MNASLYKKKLLDELRQPYTQCTGCHFSMPRATQFVFGTGNPNTKLLLIGEAPGQEEDLQGKPFVGRSGKLLDKVLGAFSLSRDNIFITNIVKIRPPNNRRPLPTEIAISRDLLLKQIKIIQPTVICTLGSSALEGITSNPVKITLERGVPRDWLGHILIPTLHPAYILRNPKALSQFMSDIEMAIQKSGLGGG